MESWSSHVQEGFLPVDGYRVWYRIVGGSGDHEGYPLMILHGGPGVPHDYLENLEALASDTRRVVFYDQLGCGRSDQPDDPSLWRVSRFADELTTVRQELGLDQVHILGQSWGGMLAIEYALRQPQGLVSLILANTTSSIPMWVAEANRLRADLPAEVNATSEFHVTGVIKDWDRTDRLAEIHVPTLILSGRYDESTPVINAVLHKGIAGSEWVVFENSSHLAHVEEPELYMQTVQAFLSRVEDR